MKLYFIIFLYLFSLNKLSAQDCTITFKEVRTRTDDMDQQWNKEKNMIEATYPILENYEHQFPSTVSIEMDIDSSCKQDSLEISMNIYPLIGDTNLHHDSKGFHRKKTAPSFDKKSIFTKKEKLNLTKGINTHIVKSTPVDALVAGLMEKNKWYWSLKYDFVLKDSSGKILTQTQIERKTPLQH